MIQQQPYIWFQLLDASETRGTQKLHVRRGINPSTAQQAATYMRGLLLACSSCAILEQRYTLPGVELFPLEAQAESDVRRTGVFIFSTATEDQYAIVVVAGLRETVLMTTGPAAGIAIDLAEPSVAAFVALLTNGTWVNKFGHVITALESAYLQVRDAVFIPDWLS